MATASVALPVKSMNAVCVTVMDHLAEQKLYFNSMFRQVAFFQPARNLSVNALAMLCCGQ